MKLVCGLALLALAGAAVAQNTGETVIAPPSTERFLNTVPPFAGGTTIPGQEGEKPLAYRDGQGSGATALPAPPSTSVRRDMSQGQNPSSPWGTTMGQPPGR